MPAAVVAHQDALDSPAVDLDRDRVGARVERVLDQFFDGRRRPLDHLARRDAVDDRALEPVHARHRVESIAAAELSWARDNLESSDRRRAPQRSGDDEQDPGARGVARRSSLGLRARGRAERPRQRSGRRPGIRPERVRPWPDRFDQPLQRSAHRAHPAGAQLSRRTEAQAPARADLQLPGRQLRQAARAESRTTPTGRSPEIPPSGSAGPSPSARSSPASTGASPSASATSARTAASTCSTSREPTAASPATPRRSSSGERGRTTCGTATETTTSSARRAT